jgi:hypothetical protein
MAAIVVKRNGYGATANRGHKVTMNDNAMKQLFDSYRKVWEPIKDPVTGIKRPLTDDEVTDKLFIGFLNGLIRHGHTDLVQKAAKDAAAAVPPANAPITPDNT